MPVAALKNISKKHGVKMKTAEKKWQEAKSIVKKQYDEDDPKFWGTVMNITKSKLKKHSSKKKKKKNEELNLEMPAFSLNENLQKPDTAYMLIENILKSYNLKRLEENGWYNELAKEIVDSLKDYKK